MRLLLAGLAAVAGVASMGCALNDALDDPPPAATPSPFATATSTPTPGPTQPPLPTPTPDRTPDVSSFDPTPVPVAPLAEECRPSSQFGLNLVTGLTPGGQFCAAWDDPWEDETGFVVRMELDPAGLTFHYQLEPGALGLTLPAEAVPACPDRADWVITLFVLRPTGNETADTRGAREAC